MDGITDSAVALYQPLEMDSSQIRLLHLLPAIDESSQLQGYLETVTLEHAPSTPAYVALSYEWVNEAVHPGDERHITINHHEVCIRPNLALALLCFRKRITEPLVIWIDALCINQTDLEERGVQVEMMKRIYELASGVWVWLGPEADRSNLAMYVIAEVQRYSEEREGHYSPLMKFILSLLYASEYEEHRHSLRKLLERSYWRRVWIIQEVVLGACGDLPMLCCGEQKTALGHIFRLVSRFRDAGSGELGDEPASATELHLAAELVSGLGDHIEEHSQEYPNFKEAEILHLLARYQRNLCSDPRDKVYGLLGVMPARLRVDYSISTAELYKHIARLIIESSMRLDLLQWCVRSNEDDQDAPCGRPSWAPDWSIDLKSSNLRLPVHSEVYASKGRKAKPDPEIVGDRLYAQAKLCRRVLGVFQIQKSNLSLSAEQYLRSLLNSILRSSPWQADIPSEAWLGMVNRLFRQLYETLCYAAAHPPDFEKSKHFVSWCIDSLNDNFRPLGDVAEISKVLDLPELKVFTSTEYTRQAPNSRPDFKSIKYTVGLCVAQARTGDIIALLSCKYPLLLREKEEEQCETDKKWLGNVSENCAASLKASEMYQVVGECYITDLKRNVGNKKERPICLV